MSEDGGNSATENNDWGLLKSTPREKMLALVGELEKKQKELKNRELLRKIKAREREKEKKEKEKRIRKEKEEEETRQLALIKRQALEKTISDKERFLVKYFVDFYRARGAYSAQLKSLSNQELAELDNILAHKTKWNAYLDIVKLSAAPIFLLGTTLLGVLLSGIPWAATSSVAANLLLWLIHGSALAATMAAAPLLILFSFLYLIAFYQLTGKVFSEECAVKFTFWKYLWRCRRYLKKKYGADYFPVQETREELDRVK